MDEKAENPVQEKVDAERRPVHIAGWKSGRKSGAVSLTVSGALFAALFLLWRPASDAELKTAWWLSLTFWNVFVGFVAFMALFTGRIARWRALFFVVLAWGFLLQFKTKLLGLQGGLFTTPDVQEVPFCHIAIVSSILNFAYQQYLALKSGQWELWGPLGAGVLWVIVTLALGQAWCSWGCFYGGLDDGFSRLFRKPKIVWRHLPEKLRDLPAALLVFFILISLSAFLPMFCLWACPLKITTAFLDPNDAVRKIQFGIYATLGIATLILLPLLTKKRVFCGLLCPFGAWQAFFGNVNPFRVTIAPDRCTQCGLCLNACPVFAISRGGLKDHRISAYCNRCGECVDVCPTSAISYTIFGRVAGWPGASSLLRESADVRVFFVFSALLVGGVIGRFFVPDLLARVFGWLSA